MCWFYLRLSANQRSASGAGVSTPCGAVRTGGSPFSSPVCRSCKHMEGFMIGGCEPILPVRGDNVRSPTNQRSARWTGVSTPCGAVSSPGITVFFSRLLSCRRMEGFMILGWDTIVPGWRCLHMPRPISDRPTWLGFLHRAGWYRPGGLTFSSPVRRSCRNME